MSFSINDGVADSASVVRPVEITALNDDPQNTGTLPGNQVIQEDIPALVDLAGLNLVDADADNDPVTVVIESVTGGTLIGGAAGSLIVSGNSGTELRVTGSLSNVNQWLDSANAVTYTPVADAYGIAADQLNISINDNDNNGVGSGSDVGIGAVQIDITGINDAPVGKDASISINEDNTYVFSVSDFGFLDLTDRLAAVQID